MQPDGQEMSAMCGGGKYAAECAAAHRATGAYATLLIVVYGNKGCGFSIQQDSAYLPSIADMLRHIANQIDDDTGRKN